MDAFLRIRHPDYDVDQRMEFVEAITYLDGVHFRIRDALKPSNGE